MSAWPSPNSYASGKIIERGGTFTTVISRLKAASLIGTILPSWADAYRRMGRSWSTRMTG
jgi:hypothetical protein